MTQKIYEQIETTADYYTPGTYLFPARSVASLLTMWSDLDIQPDPLSNDFIPISSVGQNPKLFVVGIIPPSANITGNPLDRSASVASIQGSSPATSLSYDVVVSTAGAKASSKVAKGSDLPPEFWSSYVGMCRRLGCDPNEMAAVIQAESGFNPSAVAIREGRPIAKGLNQITRPIGTKNLKMPGDTWDNFQGLSAQEQLAWVEKYMSKSQVRGLNKTQIYAKNFGGYMTNPPINGVVPRYLSEDAYSKLSPEEQTKVLEPKKQFAAYRQNRGLDKSGKGFISTDDLGANVAGYPTPDIRARIAQGQSIPTIEDPSAIANDGSTSYGAEARDAARTSSQQMDKAAQTELNSSDLGKRLQAVQKAQAIYTSMALEAMRNAPPLRMLVNPQSFSLSDNHVVSDGNWSRSGPIIEHWGLEQTKLSVSGRLAAFFALQASDANGPGLTRSARNFSKSWQNFQSLFLFYKNNGGLFLPNPTDQGLTNNLSLVGSVYIYYDNVLYLGSFDSFSITETDTSPFTAEYSYEFSCRSMFVLDSSVDSARNYGAQFGQ